MKKRFLNPEIDVLWFDEVEMDSTTSATHGNSNGAAAYSLDSNSDRAAEGMSDSFTTIIKASDLQ